MRPRRQPVHLGGAAAPDGTGARSLKPYKRETVIPVPCSRKGSVDRQLPLDHQERLRHQKEAWQACREAMREADRGRVVKPSTRTVAQFFTEWFAAIEPSIDATT